jgi:hypothetical protein
MRKPGCRIALGRVAGTFALTAIIAAQEPPRTREEQQQPAEDTPARSGARVNRLSIYSNGISASGVQLVGNSPWSGPIAGVGSSADVGWRGVGSSSTISIDYQAAYDWNNRQPEINGWDHAVQLSIRTRESSRARFALMGSAENRRRWGLLFDPLSVMTMSLTPSMETLRNTLEETRDAGTPLAPTLDTWLFGQRIRRATGRVTAGYAQSPRLSWYSTVWAERILPGQSGDGQSPAAFPFADVTSGAAGGGFQYAISRRSALGGTANYGRNFSGTIRSWMADAGLNFSRAFSEHWFGYLAGGYGVMREIAPVLLPTARSYNGGIGLGAVRGSHTFVLLARRGLTSRYGLGVMRSQQGEVTWSWLPRARPWEVSATGSYQMLTGGGQPDLNGWTGQCTLTRRLSRHLDLTAEAVYADMGRSGMGMQQSASVRGVRISLVWHPRRTRT